MQTLSDWLHRNSAFMVYLVMMVLTAITYAMGRMGMAGTSVVLVALFIALFKGQLVIDHFMGLRQVRWFWRAILYGYLVVLGVALAAAFILAS
ncbi:MAG: hypothetical protein Kow006_04130 [Gammaproteobacteria bacterium]